MSLHSKGNTLTKRDSRTDKQDFAREGPMHIIQCYIIKKNFRLKLWHMLAISLTGCLHLQVFRCPTYYHVKKDKLDPRVKKGVFLRFKKGVKDYKIWNPKTKSLSSAEMSHLMRLQC